MCPSTILLAARAYIMGQKFCDALNSRQRLCDAVNPKSSLLANFPTASPPRLETQLISQAINSPTPIKFRDADLDEILHDGNQNSLRAGRRRLQRPQKPPLEQRYEHNMTSSQLSSYIEDQLCLSLTLLKLDNKFLLPKSADGRSKSGRGQKGEQGLHQMFNPGYIQTVWAPKFHLFSQLPIELRLDIWQLSLPRERVLEIKRITEHSLQYQFSFEGWGAADSIPTALHTCRESRQEALRFYQLSFSTPHGKPTTYFDPSFDILLFRHENMNCAEFLHFFSNHLNADKVTSLAFCTKLCKSIPVWKDGKYLEESLNEAKRTLGHLQYAFCTNHAESLLHQNLKLKKCRCEASEWISNETKKIVESFLGVALTRARIPRASA